MKFNSKTLQARFDELKPLLESLKLPDAVSEDIKGLEVYLGTLHLKEDFTLNLNFNTTPSHQEELLVWNHKTQRLLYVKNHYGVACLSHDKGYYQHINYDDKEVLIELPLVEAPSEVKKRIGEEEKLSLFLSLFSQSLNAQHRNFFYFN
ncbi:hypothetical protein [Legionella sp. km772]|uniref:hypothetical protein n=1 Tax=Legionella sp. km772 TaxID=2498111 RepID=UPI000F8DE80F|nr:hypothetical protein [Legionella sp. km772]RUR04852.1 hypothetical protein ELY15_15040 [Legionella sp. km772]